MGLGSCRTCGVVASRTMPPSKVFALPSPGRQLPDGLSPRLASWNAATHPEQIAVQSYLNGIDEFCSDFGDPEGLALRLDVGRPLASPLLGAGGDLDNYLFPVAARLGANRFDTAWCSKKHGPSALCIEPARACPAPVGSGWVHRHVATAASASSTAWKKEVASQVAPADPGDGPLELQIAYRISPARNWANLWKPTIDSLGALLGEGPRPFHPSDDRITLLGLHRTVDDSIGWDVQVDIWCRPAGS